MGEIAFSRPEGRVRVFYPDEMSIEHLRGSLDLHLRLAIAAQDKLEHINWRDDPDAIVEDDGREGSRGNGTF